MAPEQLSDLVVSAESDVWAYGVVLYELLARHEPWPDIKPAVAAHRILSGERLELDAAWPTVYREIMIDCWQTEPADRPTMDEICERFAE